MMMAGGDELTAQMMQLQLEKEAKKRQQDLDLEELSPILLR